MKKKRLLIYAALIAVFALACTAHLVPGVLVRAYSYSAAETGTASLADEGDTVFVRMAVFTIGEGDDAEKIEAPGFTVANAAQGENPAEGVNLDVLTPITKENPLTGELDKDIYVCTGDGWLTDLYLGDLTLTGGHRLYTAGATGLNLLGGSLTAPAVVTKNIISIGSADVTVNSDLTGFNYIVLFASKDALNGEAANKPASLTVNGSVSNTGSYCSAAIDVCSGSSLTVTGDVYTEAAVVVTSDAKYGKSSLTVNGSVTVKKSPGWGLQLNNSDAVIGGEVKADNWVHLTNNSTMKAGSVNANLLAATQNSSFEIDGDVTLSYCFDVSASRAATSDSIGGNLECNLFNLVGPSKENPVSLHVGGDVTAGDFDSINSLLDVDGSISKTSNGYFLFQASEVEVDGNVSGSNFELDHSAAFIHGNLTVPGDSDWYVTPIHGSTLTVDGDADCWQFNPFDHSTVTVKGKLTTNGLFPVNDASSVTCKNMETKYDTGIKGASTLTVTDKLTSRSLFHIEDASSVTAKDLTATNDMCLEGASTITVTGKLTSGSLVNVREKSKLVLNDAEVTYPNPVNGTVTVSGTLKVKANGYFTLNDGASVTVNKVEAPYIGVEEGSILNVTDSLTCNNLVAVCEKSTLHVGGNATCPYIDSLGGSTVEIDGDLQCGGLFGSVNSCGVSGSAFIVHGNAAAVAFTSNPGCTIEVGKDLTYRSNWDLAEGDVTVDGDLVCTGPKCDISDGLFVTGNLTVGGDVKMNDLLLNYNDYATNTAISGDITAYRKADIIKPVEGSYVVEGEAFAETNDGAYRYNIPFGQQTVGLTINGDAYAMDVRDLSKKAYTPVPVSGEYKVTYNTSGAEFKDSAVAEERYFPEMGLILPVLKDFKPIPDLRFSGWYTNAGFEGEPVTEIPAGSTGDVNLFAKYIECDHKDSEKQPTCTESAICSICEAELPALGHTWNEPAWNWDDVEHPTYSTTCSVCTEGEASGEADSVGAVDTAATVDADGYTTYTATVTLGSQVFSDDFVVTDEGSMLEAGKAAFETYKTEQGEAAGNKALEGDSEQCAGLIADAQAAIAALEYDEDKSFEENKAAVDEIIAQLEDDLAEHRHEYTATFTGNGVTAGTVRFTIDTESIKDKEPAVPEKAGYTGEWEDYTLGAQDITVKAVYTAITYTATFVDENGKTVDTRDYDVETESVDEPAVPEKKGYEGKWQDYTLKIGGVTVKAVYTSITTITLGDVTETTGYKESRTFTAEAKDMPEGAEVHWFVNGEDVGTGSSYTVEEPTEDYTVAAKVIDKDGNVLVETEEQTVKVKNGFFDRLIAFLAELIEKILGKAIVDFFSSVC